MAIDPTLGGQVVLPQSSLASRAARGVAAATIDANVALRDGDLAGYGFNTLSPSGNYPATVSPTLLTHVPVTSQFSNSTSNGVDDTTNNSLNSRMTAWAPTNSDITNIMLVYPSFATNPAETDWPVASYTVTAAIEYPAGTFYPVYTSAGSRSLVVNAGRSGLASFAPAAITIPAGAQFWIKTYATWSTGHFWLTAQKAGYQLNEWTTRAVGASDLTLSASAQTATSSLVGFGPNIYGTLVTPSSVLGVIGDSISVVNIYGKQGNAGGSTWIGEAMRGVLPVLNLGAGGDTIKQYLLRQDGRMSMMRDRITHLLFLECRNDINSADSVATIQANLQQAIAPWLAKGVKVWACTCVPTTTSTDSWATVANQTAGVNEAKRQQYNSWLLSNVANLGLSGVLDWGHAVDPGDTGKWQADGTAYAGARGFSTLTNGVITACTFASYNGDASAATNGYPANQSGVPLVITNQPGCHGSGAVITGNTNASSQILSYTITNGGSGFTYPPNITIAGRWTDDGVHPNRRALDQIIRVTQMRPEMFV